MAKENISAIESELREATGVKPKKKEDRQDYLARMHDAVQDMDEDDWDALSEEAQEFANSLAMAVKKKKKLPDFPADDDDEDEAPKSKKKKKAAAKDDDDEDEDDDSDDDESDDDEDDEDDEDEDESPKSKKKKKAAKDDDDEDEDDDSDDDESDEDDEDDEDESPKKKGKEAKVSGVKANIKKLLIAKPDMSVEAIMKKLGKGSSKATVSQVRAEFRHSLAVLQDEGKLKGVKL